MNIALLSATTIALSPSSSYLPAAAYRPYVHAEQYGFAAINNQPDYIAVPFATAPSASPIVVGFGGGDSLAISGVGFLADCPDCN